MPTVHQEPNRIPPHDRKRWLAAFNYVLLSGKSGPFRQLPYRQLYTVPPFGMTMISEIPFSRSKSNDGQFVFGCGMPSDLGGAGGAVELQTNLAQQNPLRQPWFMACNGPTPIPPLGYGELTQDWPAQCYVDVTGLPIAAFLQSTSGNTTPGSGAAASNVPREIWAGLEVGPVDGSFFPSPDGTGFFIVDIDVTEDQTVAGPMKSVTSGSQTIQVQSKLRRCWIAPLIRGRTASHAATNYGAGTITAGSKVAPTAEMRSIYEFSARPRYPWIDEGIYKREFLGQNTTANGKILARVNCSLQFNVSATLSSSTAPDGAKLAMQLVEESPTGEVSNTYLKGHRTQAFTFRSADSNGDTFPSFFSKENVAFGGVLKLTKGYKYYVINSGEHTTLYEDVVFSVAEISPYNA
jgi:hypothetical protein